MNVRVLISLAAGALGLLVPLGLLKFELDQTIPALILWPLSITFMVPHRWPSERAIAISFGVVLLLNSIVYAYAIFLGTRRLKKPLPVVTRLTGWMLTLSGWAVIVAATAIVTMSGRPILYEIPADYRGWLVIEYANRACAPLPSRGIMQVAAFPASGHLCTSSPQPLPDSFRQSVYQYGAAGSRKRLAACDRDDDDVCIGRLPPFARKGYHQHALFVGTVLDFRAALRASRN